MLADGGLVMEARVLPLNSRSLGNAAQLRSGQAERTLTLGGILVGIEQLYVYGERDYGRAKSKI